MRKGRLINKEKLIKLLEDCQRTGELPKLGLCYTLKTLRISRRKLDLFAPTGKDIDELKRNYKPTFFWGRESYKYETNAFTPLREMVLCFLIAMED